jgi:GDP-4-dehydro-6-deoxy-D-mannose reductase
MRALITGVTGFAGSHLAEYLLAEGLEIFGTRRLRSPMENIAHLQGKITLLEAELTDQTSVSGLLETSNPDLIFHLAAMSFVKASWAYPGYTLFNNVSSQLCIFEAVRALKLDPRIQIAGSSEEYGLAEESELPLREESPLRPLSPYGVSKVAQDMLAYQYFHSYGMKVVRTRAFNHTGPRRGDIFATSSFARQIAEIELGMREPVISVGNLDAQRDFSDVRDVVRAYYLACTKGEPGDVYNICSGKAVTIREMLDILLRLAKREVQVKVETERLRPSDVQLLRGDAAKIRKAVGWEPKYDLQATLADLLDYWRGRLGAHT